MDLLSVFAGAALPSFIDSVFVDFTLAFTFFTALCFAILSRHFGRQRSAAAMSVALGLGLSIGLMWWESEHGFSVRDLGPLGMGLIVVVLAGVVFQAIRQVGGGWSGVGVAVGVAVGIAWLAGPGGAVSGVLISLVVLLALGAGAAALVIHRGHSERAAPPWVIRTSTMDDDMRVLYRDRVLSERVADQLRDVRRRADTLNEQPEQAGDVMVQLRRILPEAGLLTEQLAQLRAIAHRVRRGHVARIEELRSVIAGLPPEQRREVAEELARRHEELKFNVRIDRLDRAVADNERRIRELIRQAEEWLENHEYRRLSRVLDEAVRLQRQNAQLLQVIERSQQRLLAGAQKLAEKSAEVNRG